MHLFLARVLIAYLRLYHAMLHFILLLVLLLLPAASTHWLAKSIILIGVNLLHMPYTLVFHCQTYVCTLYI